MLGDFGLVGLITDEKRMSRVGTQAYMAPEVNNFLNKYNQILFKNDYLFIFLEPGLYRA